MRVRAKAKIHIPLRPRGAGSTFRPGGGASFATVVRNINCRSADPFKPDMRARHRPPGAPGVLGGAGYATPQPRAETRTQDRRLAACAPVSAGASATTATAGTTAGSSGGQEGCDHRLRAISQALRPLRSSRAALWCSYHRRSEALLEVRALIKLTLTDLSRVPHLQSISFAAPSKSKSRSRRPPKPSAAGQRPHVVQGPLD